MPQTKRRIVITGAGGALGSVLAAHLAEQAQVVLVDRPQARDRLDELAASLGTHARVACFDVTDPAAWREQAIALDEPDGAALIAGGWQGGKPLHEEEGDRVWRAMLQTNLESAYQSLRALLPGMVARGQGSLVVVGSRNVERPFESAGAAAYGASKAAVVALAQAVAAEVRDAGVRVNAVLPSVIDTPGNRQAMPDADFSAWVSRGSLAETIGFLLGPGARDISGAAVPVYGRA